MKSIRNLLWVLWGLGWIIVPLLLREIHAQRYIPLVMFGSLAMLFIVTWHKGAILRAALRSLFGRAPLEKATTVLDASSPKQRVEVAPQRVRVHATAPLRPEEVVGNTEVDADERADRRRARQR